MGIAAGLGSGNFLGDGTEFQNPGLNPVYQQLYGGQGAPSANNPIGALSGGNLQDFLQLLGANAPQFMQLIAQTALGQQGQQQQYNLGQGALANQKLGLNNALQAAALGPSAQLKMIQSLFPGGIGAALGGLFGNLGGMGGNSPMGMQSSSGAGFSFGGRGQQAANGGGQAGASQGSQVDLGLGPEMNAMNYNGALAGLAAQNGARLPSFSTGGGPAANPLSAFLGQIS